MVKVKLLDSEFKEIKPQSKIRWERVKALERFLLREEPRPFRYDNALEGWQGVKELFPGFGFYRVYDAKIGFEEQIRRMIPEKKARRKVINRLRGSEIVCRENSEGMYLHRIISPSEKVDLFLNKIATAVFFLLSIALIHSEELLKGYMALFLSAFILLVDKLQRKNLEQPKATDEDKLVFKVFSRMEEVAADLVRKAEKVDKKQGEGTNSN